MQKINILNTREVKRIREQVVKQFGHFPKKDYAYLMNEKNRLFLVNKDLGRVDLKKLKIDKMGMYFAEVKPNHVRLSKEGAQLLVKDAAENDVELQNVVELSKTELKEYFTGVDLAKDLGEEDRLIIVKYEDNVIGCAKYKERKILNFLPKMYRGEVIV